MNNVLVKHNKWLFGIFAVIIIIAFVWFFTPGVDGSLLFGNGGANSEYGSVFDEEITYTDLYELMTHIDVVNGVQAGTSPSGYAHSTDDQVLRNVFSYAVLIKTAQMQGLYVTDEDVAKYLSTLPFFQQDGKFSPELYGKYVAEKLEKIGYSEKDMIDAFKSLMLIEKLNAFAVNNVVVTDQDLADFMVDMMTKINARKVVLPVDALQKSLNLTDDELLAYYSANPDSFMTQPVSDGVVAYLPYKGVQTEVVIDAEQVNEILKLQDGFEKFSDTEKAVKKAEIEKSLREKQQMELIAKKVVDFAHVMKALAKQPEFEEGPENHFRTEATKLGLYLMDVKNLTPVTPASDEIEADLIRSLTVLKNVNSVTNVIKGANGCYVAILTGRKPAEVAKFAEVKADVEKACKSEKLSVLSQEVINKLRGDLAQSEDPAADLEKIAASVGAKVLAYPAFSAFSVMKNAAMISPEDQMLQYLIFQTKEKNLSMPIPSADEYTMVFVDGRIYPGEDEWQKEITEEYKQSCLSLKQQQAAESFQNWVFSNAKVIELPNQAN